MPACCAFGCKLSGVSLHRFPNATKFPERFRTWVTLVGGTLDSEKDFEYFKNQRVCDIHFIDSDRNRYKRLNALAIPSLHMQSQANTADQVISQSVLDMPSSSRARVQDTIPQSTHNDTNNKQPAGPASKYKKCELCYKVRLRNSKIFLSKFPLDPERCRAWVKMVGMEDLVYIPIEKLNSLKYLCGDHFEKCFWNKRRNRLSKTAVPTLNLLYPPLPDHLLLEFPFRTNFKTATVRKTLPIPNITKSKVSNVQESTQNTDCHKKEEESIDAQRFLPDAVRIEDPTTLHQVIKFDDAQVKTATPNTEVNPSKDMQEHNLTVDITKEEVKMPVEDLTMYEDESMEPEVEDQKDDDDLHVGFMCNVCDSDIRGFRYICVQCVDWDMCGSCEARGAHRQHYVLRLPGPRPQNEIQNVLDRIRRELLDFDVFIENSVKDEDDDVEPEHDPLHHTSVFNEGVESDNEQDESMNAIECGDNEPAEDLLPKDDFVISVECSATSQGIHVTSERKSESISKHNNESRSKQIDDLSSDNINVSELTKISNVPSKSLLKSQVLETMPSFPTGRQTRSQCRNEPFVIKLANPQKSSVRTLKRKFILKPITKAVVKLNPQIKLFKLNAKNVQT